MAVLSAEHLDSNESGEPGKPRRRARTAEPSTQRRAVAGRLAWVGALAIAAVIGYLVETRTAAGGPPSTTGPTTPLLGGFAGVPAGSGTARLLNCVIQATALGVLCALVVRASGWFVAARWRPFAPAALTVTALGTSPVRDAFARQSPTLCLAVIVLVSIEMARRNRRYWSRADVGSADVGAALLGCAAAVQPALMLFALLLARGERPRRVLAASGAAFGVLTATGWALRPRAARTYWLHGGLLGGPAAADGGNESVRGLALRLNVHGVDLGMTWPLIAAVLVIVVAVRASRYAADGQQLLAIGLIGCTVALLEPVTLEDGLLWLGFAAAGRVGHRRQDRGVWPVVAFIPLVLPSHVLDPHIEAISSFLLHNCAGLLALAVVCVVPFRLRTDPLWRLAGPIAGPARRRTGLPLLPPALRGRGRPNLVLELLMVQVGYGAYTWVRNVAPNRSDEAISNGQGILRVERFLHIDVERAFNRFALNYDWLEDALEHYYKTLHFAVPLTVLVWLYWRHPVNYRRARTALFLCTGLALVGFWAFPLAPPRLTPGHGFRDTLHPGADADPLGAFTKLANQFAAMPSLHIGWSTWSAVVIVVLAPCLWIRVLGAVYPAITLFAILATANHWILDAVGGAATLAAAWAIQYALTGRHLRDPDVDPIGDTAISLSSPLMVTNPAGRR